MWGMVFLPTGEADARLKSSGAREVYATRCEYSHTYTSAGGTPRAIPRVMPAQPVCAVCKRPVTRPERGTMGDFPFCSPRCKAVDLSHWLDGGYRIPEDPWGDDLGVDMTDLPDDDGR